MASLSTCHLGLWLGWQILLNLFKSCLSHHCHCATIEAIVKAVVVIDILTITFIIIVIIVTTTITLGAFYQLFATTLSGTNSAPFPRHRCCRTVCYYTSETRIDPKQCCPSWRGARCNIRKLLLTTGHEAKVHVHCS